jgi:hypothetical protein
MKPCPEVIRPGGRTGAKGKEAVERKQFYQVGIARRFTPAGSSFQHGKPKVSPRNLKSLARNNKTWMRAFGGALAG